MSHACPADGCELTVAGGKLMCFAHWRMVPHPLQIDIYRAWRAVLSARDRAQKLEAMKLHRAARDAAVNAVREREIKRELRA